jgi:hypothetical protein
MHTHETKRNVLVDSEPPMALDKFIEQTGLSPVTVWRFRKKKFLQTVNICGRHYVLRSEIARFNASISRRVLNALPSPLRIV